MLRKCFARGGENATLSCCQAVQQAHSMARFGLPGKRRGGLAHYVEGALPHSPRRAMHVHKLQIHTKLYRRRLGRENRAGDEELSWWATDGGKTPTESVGEIFCRHNVALRRLRLNIVSSRLMSQHKIIIIIIIIPIIIEHGSDLPASVLLGNPV